VFLLQGLLITLEGIDGCGKSTQADLLLKKIKTVGIECLLVREPGGTPVGEDIRQVILNNHYSLSMAAELLLYMAARSELSGQVIIPALLDGKIVLCDRFTDSTLAYQGYGGGADLQWIRILNHQAARGLIPGLTFLLDLSAEEATDRRKEGSDRMERKTLNFHRRVRQGYLQLACNEPQRFVVINANDSVESIEKAIWSALKPLIDRLGKR
jgi:dTMP kinase